MSQSTQFGTINESVSTASCVSLYNGMSFVSLFNSITINL